jgi:hypothetical protein
MCELFSWLFINIEINSEFEVRVKLYIKEEFLIYKHY